MMTNYKRFSFRFNQLVDCPKRSEKSSFEDFVELLEF